MDVNDMKRTIAVLLALSLIGCTSVTETPVATQPSVIPSVEPSPTIEVISSPTSAPLALGPEVIHYRADLQRTGSYDFPGIRVLPEVRWQKQMLASASLGSPVFADGILYISAQNGKLYAYDAETGEETWSVRAGRLPASVAVAGDLIFVNDLNNTVNAFLRETGEQVWSMPVAGSGWGAPLVVDETVFVTSERGAYAFEARTGATIWDVETGDHQGFIGSPAYADGVVYFGAGGNFFAIDASSGEERWKLEGETWFYGPAISDGNLYVGNDDGQLHVYDLETGQERWHSETKGAGWSAPAIADGVIYVGNVDQHLYAFDAQTGEELWSFETADWATSDPVVSGGVVYFGVGNHDNREGPRPLYAIDAQAGEELWQFEAGSRLMTAPALSDGTIYIVSILGQVYALTGQ